MGLALISFSMSMFVIAAFNIRDVLDAWEVLSQLWLDGVFAAIVAILDVFARHRSKN